MKKLGYGRCVVILTQSETYRKEKSPTLPLIRFVLRKYPRLAEAMEKRPERYNAHIAAICADEKAGKCLVIRPPAPLPVHRTENDPDRLEQAYQIGRAETMRKMTEIRRFL